MKLDLNDLRPQEATFELSEKPGKHYVLKKLSLAVQIWLNQKFTKEKISEIFENQSLSEISEIVYHLLKDKTDFPTLESLQESIVTHQDRMAIMMAMLTTVGISQPVLDQLVQGEIEGNEQSPGLKPTGAPYTIS